MNNKFILIFFLIFLSFCFIIFYKGLNTPNNYTPKISEEKNIPLFKAKDFNSNIDILQIKFLKKIAIIL